ncbi:hypothetical protein BN871_FL_00070 [Paenibacillus sp. P22]|nr:hypothetical protein BN871_FL_00070 [Paenibacillus sp. P22]
MRAFPALHPFPVNEEMTVMINSAAHPSSCEHRRTAVFVIGLPQNGRMTEMPAAAMRSVHHREPARCAHDALPERIRNDQPALVLLAERRRDLGLPAFRDLSDPIGLHDQLAAKGNQRCARQQRLQRFLGCMHGADADDGRPSAGRIRNPLQPRLAVVRPDPRLGPEVHERHMEIVQLPACKRVDQLQRVVHRDAVLLRFFRREAVSDGKRPFGMLGDDPLYLFHHRERKRHPFGQIPAPAVVAAVRMRREKLLQQVSVRAVNLHPVEARLNRPPRRLPEVAHDGFDLFILKRPWPDIPVLFRRYVARTHDISVRHQLRRTQAPAVENLQQRYSPFFLDRGRKTPQAWNHVVGVGAEFAGEPFAVAGDVGACGHDHADAAGATDVIVDLGVRHRAVLIRRPVRHRGHDDSIVHPDAASQRKIFK